jgi:ankyrin repeat protein
VARILLDTGAQLEAPDNQGLTSLHNAALSGHDKIAELLIACGAAVNAKNAKKLTPLHLAALRGHKRAAELLVAAGADVGARDAGGGTPMDVAIEKGHMDLATFLARRDTYTMIAETASADELFSDLCAIALRDDERDRAPCRTIGELFYRSGGLRLMIETRDEVAERTGKRSTQRIDEWWEGIGGWRR